MPPQANRARDEATEMVANSWLIRGPIKGARRPQASYMSPGREVSFMPLRVVWHLAVQVFAPGITSESHLKQPGPDLMGGGGALAPI
jgi:hypothetical protein